MKRIVLFLMVAVMAAGCCSNSDKGARNYKIWDEGYSAFTSIEEFQGAYYVAFREAESHIFNSKGIADGKARILRSKDGENWESVALLSKEGYDLRDPKLSVTADGRLMVILGGSVYENKKLMAQIPHVSFSSDGKDFTDPVPVEFGPEITDQREWIWRVTWNGDTGYGITYGEHFALVSTRDGVHFDLVKEIEDLDGFPGESTIRFDKSGRMYMMVRRELEDRRGMWGVSEAPYTDWTWTPMDFHLGGPDFIVLDDGTIVAGSRYEFPSGVNKTMILRGNAEGRFEPEFLVPSGGDTSYPGFLQVGDEIWVTYYSCHENMGPGKDHRTNYNGGSDKRRASIYLEKLPLSLFIRK